MPPTHVDGRRGRVGAPCRGGDRGHARCLRRPAPRSSVCSLSARAPTRTSHSRYPLRCQARHRPTAHYSGHSTTSQVSQRYGHPVPPQQDTEVRHKTASPSSWQLSPIPEQLAPQSLVMSHGVGSGGRSIVKPPETGGPKIDQVRVPLIGSVLSVVVLTFAVRVRWLCETTVHVAVLPAPVTVHDAEPASAMEGSPSTLPATTADTTSNIAMRESLLLVDDMSRMVQIKSIVVNKAE